MNFKGNSFSLGAGGYVSSSFKDGECNVLIKNNGVTSHKKFNPQTRTIKTADKAFSYADLCWLTDNGVIELNGGVLTTNTNTK